MQPDAETIQRLITERDELKRQCERLQELLSNVSYPPGHFYSPVVDVNDTHAIEAVRSRTCAPVPAGVQIDPEQMTMRIERWAEHPQPFPFPRNQSSGYRFYFDNPFFGCHDARALFSILMEFRPRRVVEVGCGFSSGLLLDVNERFFEGRLDITLIDPSLDRLSSTFEWLRSPGACLLNQKVQDVPLDVFDRLEANDILFPFEYLEDWVLKEKRSWNEAYLIHAFLQFNPAFKVIYWSNFAWHRLHEALARLMPLCLENEGGSLWLQRATENSKE